MPIKQFAYRHCGILDLGPLEGERRVRSSLRAAVLDLTPGKPVLKRAKIALLSVSRGAGITQLCLNSAWRRQRLLILCYHGTSIDDEHLWNPSLYMPLALLRDRLSYLRHKQCSVLPLAEGLQRLYRGDLPPRSVSLTFDDGTYDFYKLALPVLRQFEYPVTIYITTYYSYYNQPVFDTMCSYLLWKGRGGVLRFPEVCPEELPLRDETLASSTREIRQFALRNTLSAREKNALLERLAQALEIDLDSIRSRRILHLMTPEEASDAAAAGVDIQLHTHRHRVYDSKERLQGEVTENRRWLEPIARRPLEHFCYPSGYYLPEFPGWLREIGVVSATTCNAGLAGKSSDPLLLPRLIDSSNLSFTEFAAWISGLASVLPQRSVDKDEDQLVRTPAPGAAPEAGSKASVRTGK